MRAGDLDMLLNPPEDLAAATEEVVASTAVDWKLSHSCWLNFQGL